MEAGAHIVLPLGPLFDSLRRSGLYVSPANILDIERLLTVNSLLKWADDSTYVLKAENLPGIIAPVIARNKKEQEKVIAVTQAFVAECLAAELAMPEAAEEPPPPGLPDKPDELIKEEDDGLPEVRTTREKWKRRLLPVFFILGLATFFIIRHLQQQNRIPGLTMAAVSEGVVKGDTAYYRVSLSQPMKATDSLRWFVGGDVFHTKDTVLRYVGQQEMTDSGSVSMQRAGRLHNRTVFPVSVVCNSLSIAIDSSMPAITGDAGTFRADLRDTTNTASYTYQWRLNDAVVSTQPGCRIVFTKVGVNSLKLTAYTHGACRYSDSIIAADLPVVIDSIPRLVLSATPVSGTQLRRSESPLSWKLMAAGLVVLFFAAFIVFAELSLRRPVIPETDDGPASNPDGFIDKPFKLRFESKDGYIPEDEYIDELGHLLRQKHETDWQQLNIPKTIQRTSRNAGFLSLVLEPRIRPHGFVFLIDQAREDSHLTRLLSWLAGYLQKMDVHIEVFSFRGRPEKLQNAQGIPLTFQKLTELADERHLVVFAEAACFIQEEDIRIRPKLAALLGKWPRKALVTPVPFKDWSYPEEQLRLANCIVVPAEIEAVTLMARALTEVNELTRAKIKNLIQKEYREAGGTYDFYSVAGLQAYLKDVREENLFQWLCALAVYPRLSWEITLSIGRAIAVAMDRAGMTARNKEAACAINLTYNTLLKLSRIQWLHDGRLPDGLRLELMQHLTKENHLIAREAIVLLCEELRDRLPLQSMARVELDAQHTLNTFFLYVSDKKRYQDYAGAVARMPALWGQLLDWPLQELTSRGENKLMPARPGFGKKHKTVEEYLSDAAYTTPLRFRIGLAVFTAGLALLIYSHLLTDLLPQKHYRTLSLIMPAEYCGMNNTEQVTVRYSTAGVNAFGRARLRDTLWLTVADDQLRGTGMLQASKFQASGDLRLDSNVLLQLPPCKGTAAPSGVAAATRDSLVPDPNWNGFHTFRYADGRIYKGNWKNGKRSGAGEEVMPDGTSYAGGFRNDLRDGYGTEYDRTGQPVYADIWVAGRPSIDRAHFKVYMAVRSIVSEKLGIDKNEITSNADFRSVFGADDLDVTELIMACEYQFKISLPDNLKYNNIFELVQAIANSSGNSVPEPPADFLGQLQQIIPNAPAETLQAFAAAAPAAFAKFRINTPQRQAAFLAQVAYETAGLTRFEENLNYSAESLVRIFPSIFSLPQANEVEDNSPAIANRLYANRFGNGDIASGDGWRYRGRGFFQLTGKNMYTELTRITGINYIDNPDYMSQIGTGLEAACALWAQSGLNELADKGDMKAITKKINGGLNGLNERMNYYNKAKSVLK